MSAKDTSCPNCEQFQDVASIQAKAYSSKDMQPQQTFDALYRLEKKGILKKTETCEDFIIRDLDFSLPLVHPKALTFLHQLAGRYRTHCQEAGLVYVPFTISSMTRSIESAKALQKQNGNAIENSGHLRGKTFDVTYLTPKEELKQKIIFIKTLSEMKKEGRCYVKYEINQKCLHITVR